MENIEKDLKAFREQMRDDISSFRKSARTHRYERERFAYQLMANQLMKQHDKLTKVIGDEAFSSKIW